MALAALPVPRPDCEGAVRPPWVFFRLSDDVLNSKMSTVTGMAEGRVAILITVDVFELSHFLGDSNVSTVTGISGVRVAIFVTVDAFELSDQFRS